MNPEHLERVLDHISDTIEKKVNGKLDTQHGILQKQNEVMNGLIQRLDNHIETEEEWQRRVEPVIAAYEEGKEFKKGVTEVGERVVFWSKIVAAVGVIGVAIKYAIFNAVR